MGESVSSPCSRGAAFAVALVSFGVGLLVFLFTFDKRSWLSGADDPLLALAVATLARPDGVGCPVHEGHHVFAPPPSGPSRTMVAVFRQSGAATYQDWPPGPLDVAVLLSALRERRSGVVAVTMPPVWPVAPEGTLATQALRTAVRGGEGVLFGADPAFVAVPRDGSAEMFAAMPGLPIDQVEGDVSRLPVVNDPGPPVVAAVGAENVGFSRLLLLRSLPIQDGLIAVPLVARAGDRLLFSLPLSMWMRANGIGASGVNVILGDAITAGERRIFIDDMGRILLPSSRFGRVPEQDVLDLARDDEKGGSLEGHLILVACDGQSSVKLPDGRLVSSAAVLAGVVDALDRGDFARPLHRLDLGGAGHVILGLLLLASMSGLAMFLPRWAHLVVSLMVLGAWFFAVRAQIASGVCQPMLAPVMTWLLGFVAGRTCCK